MKCKGRRVVALVGLLGTIASLLCVTTAGFADTLKNEAEISTKEIGTKENALASLVADAIKDAAKSDAAIIAASFFTKDVKIPKGNTSTAEVLKALEYRGDSLLIVKLTGSQLTKAFEHGLTLYPKTNSGFLHFAGLTVTIDPNADKEKRVVSVKIDGNPVESGKVYKVAMPAPLANGALAYFKVWKEKDIDKDSQKKLEKITLESAVTDYLKANKTIGKGDERLVVKEK